MKLLLRGLLLLCPYLSFGQSSLTVGDAVPPHALNTILSPPKKLILLDFWATNCGACIHKFGLLDSLQKKYPASFEVVLVNSVATDTKDKVARLFRRLKKPNNFLNIYGDTVLSNFFPHSYVPHYVWLDSGFKVLAITDGEAVTAANIGSVISGGHVDFVVPEDQSKFNRAKFLFFNGNGGSGKELLQRSTFTTSIAGLGSLTEIERDSAGNVSRILLINVSAAELLQRAWEYFELPVRFTGCPLPEGMYSYELITPPVSYAAARLLLQEDLRRYLGLAAELRGTTLFIHSTKTN
jgi:thiol-disulfide isomerase/thioredoxin